MIILSTTMMYRENQAFTITKFILSTTLLFTVCCLAFDKPVFAVPAFEEEESVSIDYSKFNNDKIKSEAAAYFDKALKTSDETEKDKYLQYAATRYYILSNTDKDNIDYYIALGRIYDMRKIDKYAKAYFCNALGVNHKNPNANYYFGEYYYSREKYKKALEYYKKALIYGYKGDSSEMLKKMGYMYEQYGDLDRAVMYYKNSAAMKSDPELVKKIQYIDGANYSSTGYDKKKLRR